MGHPPGVSKASKARIDWRREWKKRLDLCRGNRAAWPTQQQGNAYREYGGLAPLCLRKEETK